MATVYGIVKQNGGFINVESEVGKGTVITCFFPCYQGQGIEPRRKHHKDLPLGKGETILIVEDDPAILKLCEKMLESLGYSTLSANNPNEAIHLAEEHDGRINLLITDVIMPGMNGRQLSERLQTTCRGFKTLYMSGYTADVITNQGILEDGTFFISKPLTKKELAVKIREVLHSSGF